MDNYRVPARLVPPGQIISRELAARGWQQQDLAAITERPVQAISEIINGKKEITPETARELGCAFGTSAEFWMNLEVNYRLRLAKRQQQEDEISRRQRLYARVPYRELVKRGWIEDRADLDEQEEQVCRFLGISSLDENSPLPLAARRSTYSSPELSSLASWARRAEQVLSRRPASPCRTVRLDAGIDALLQCARQPADAASVPARLSDLGIRFAIVHHLPHTYLDGAVLQVGEQPAIGLTLRYDRMDNFWFTLMHELGHIVLGHEGVYLDRTDAERPLEDAQEREANAWASDRLIDAQSFGSFVRQGRFDRRSIVRFATQIGRHPSIVAGRLQFDDATLYPRPGWSRAKVSPYLAPWIDTAG